MTVAAEPGVKIIYLIKRRTGVTREALIAHWFANHMPGVIRRQVDSASRGQRHATRYIATLFDADTVQTWDGMAQLWWNEPLPMPRMPHGTHPTDTFQQKAAPYLPWITTEYLIMDGDLPVEPMTLNEPAFPTTRSGFYKQCYLVKAKPDTDYESLYRHWLDIHVPNVRQTMEDNGGFRYCVSHSLDPQNAPYAGLAELWFHDRDGCDAYQAALKSDGIEAYIDLEQMVTPGSCTEMIGIP